MLKLFNVLTSYLMLERREKHGKHDNPRLLALVWRRDAVRLFAVHSERSSSRANVAETMSAFDLETVVGPQHVQPTCIASGSAKSPL